MKIAKKKMDIIYEDKEFLVVNKPSKLLTIATEKEKIQTLYHQAREYIKKQNPKNKIFIVHRLDKETSGIVLFAKKEKLKEALQKNWNELAKEREYIAIIEGTLTPKKGIITNYLKESKTLFVYDTKNPHMGKKAITEYEVIEENRSTSLVKIKIQTGRKNQIRVAFSSMGIPILGDKKYGSKKNPYRRICLHAKKLIIVHPKTKKEYIFTSKIPKIWENDIKKYRNRLSEKDGKITKNNSK